ncbi:MAG TPA: transcription elongation factor GreA [Actinomycetota bacterium]|nr:transcription elongation factor GreA [Actinomycetota bacterium]
MSVSDPKDISVSSESLERMKKELEDLTGEGRDKMAIRLQRAREFGDLKENAEYHSAKEAQGLMEARIRQLQHTIKNAVVREGPLDADKAGLGMIVSVKDGDDVEDYFLTASSEDKIAGVRTVTTSSPLGSALHGKSVGDEVKVDAPGGAFTVEIVGLRPA